MRKRLMFAVAGLVFAVTGVSAETRRIPVDEAVKMAIDSNLTLEASRVSLDTKKRKNDLKWNEFIPTLSVKGSLIRDNETIKQPVLVGSLPVTNAETGLYDPVYFPYEASQWHVSGGVSAQISIVAALFEGLKRFRLDYETGVLSYDKARSAMERDLRKLYNNILLAEENLRLQKEKLTQLERAASQAQTSYRSGLAPELQYMQAQVAVGNQRPVVDEAENNVRLVKANFAFTIGLPYGAEVELVPLEGSFTPVSLEVGELIKEAARKKPDILELRHNILLMESGRKAQAMMAWTPSLTLQWSSQSSFKNDPFKDEWGGSDNWNKQGDFRLILGFTLNGIVPWFKEWQGLKDMDNQIKSLNINLAQLVRGTEIEVYNNCLTLEKTQASIEAMRQNVDLAERSFRSTETAYRSGLQTLLELQNAATQLQEAQLGAQSQRVSYLNSLIDLEYNLGIAFGSLK